MQTMLNGYPATYPQYYPQFQPTQPNYQQNNVQNQQYPVQQQEQKTINGFDWVLGPEGAASYIVPAGKTFILFDAIPNNMHFYLKSSDMSGKPSPAVMFDYSEHKEDQTQKKEKAEVDLSGCVKKDDFDSLRKELDELKKKPEPNYLTSDDVREIFDELIGDRFAQFTAATHETKTRKKEA